MSEDMISKCVNSKILEDGMNALPLDILIKTQTGVKSVQRGMSAASGYFTISEVDTAKTFVVSVSKGSSGTVATSGTISMAQTTAAQADSNVYHNTGTNGILTNSPTGGATNINIRNGNITIPIRTGSYSGGTTDIYVKEYSAQLYSSTQIYCDGACEWQVIENW